MEKTESRVEENNRKSSVHICCGNKRPDFFKGSSNYYIVRFQLQFWNLFDIYGPKKKVKT